MKLSSLLLSASLLCNVVIVPFYIYRQTATSLSGTAKTTIQISAPKTNAKINIDDDVHAFLDHLRAEGFPPDIIGIIIRDKLDKEFFTRRKALSEPPKPFWHPEFTISPYDILKHPSDPEARAARRALEKEYVEILRALPPRNDVGAVPINAGATEDRAAAYGKLSESKIDQIEAIKKDYSDLSAKIREGSKSVKFPDDEQQLDLLSREERADIEKLLTPDELHDYDLRTSPTANAVQSRIRYFGATEEEYLDLYAAQQAYEEQYVNASLTREQARALNLEMAKAVLSPERFAEYLVTTSSSYTNIKSLVREHKLPEAAIATAVNIQEEINARADAIGRDASLSSTARESQLTALAFEARNQLLPVLGEEAYAYYVNYDEEWIKKRTAAAIKTSGK